MLKPTLSVSEMQALKLLMQLLPMPGPSCQEGLVAATIVARLKTAGLPRTAISFDNAHKKSDVAGGECGNLIIKLPGTTKKPRRLFSAHMDTVPLCVGTKPVRRGGRIVSANKNTGVGADNRAGVAALLYILEEILRRKLPHPPLTFLFTVQEEWASRVRTTWMWPGWASPPWPSTTTARRN